LQIGCIPRENLDACARVLARLAVEKALAQLELDRGSPDSLTTKFQHRSGPAGVGSTDEAMERVK
jgi:hypothetical protein